MYHLKPETLNRESFRKLGDYEDLLTLGDRYEGKPVNDGFFPDAIQMDNSGKAVSFSVTRVSGQVDVVKTAEYHANAYEGILPLDGDVYIFAAPSYWYSKFNEVKLFRVPKGTLVKLRPGVIHGAPLSVTGETVNVLSALPERTYANDCAFMELDEAEWLKIEAE